MGSMRRKREKATENRVMVISIYQESRFCRFFRFDLDSSPEAVHELFLFVVERVEDDERVAIFLKGGFGPVGRAHDEGLPVDVGEFVVQQLGPLAKQEADA